MTLALQIAIGVSSTASSASPLDLCGCRSWVRAPGSGGPAAKTSLTIRERFRARQTRRLAGVHGTSSRYGASMTTCISPGRRRMRHPLFALTALAAMLASAASAQVGYNAPGRSRRTRWRPRRTHADGAQSDAAPHRTQPARVVPSAAARPDRPPTPIGAPIRPTPSSIRAGTRGRRRVAARPTRRHRGRARDTVAPRGRLSRPRGAGHDRRRYAVQGALPRAAGRTGDPLRHRRRPAGLRLVRHEDGLDEEGMAGLAPAAGDAASAGPTCRASWRAARTTRSAPARSISARRSTASTAPTSRTRSAERLVRLHPHDERRRGRPLRPASAVGTRVKVI